MVIKSDAIDMNPKEDIFADPDSNIWTLISYSFKNNWQKLNLVLIVFNLSIIFSSKEIATATEIGLGFAVFAFLTHLYVEYKNLEAIYLYNRYKDNHQTGGCISD